MLMTVTDNENIRINTKRNNVVTFGSSSFNMINFIKDTALI